MIYLLHGEDSFAKDDAIQKIRQKYLTHDALAFDYETLDAKKCAAAELKKALISLPALAQKRIVLIRSAEKLSPYNKELILDYARQGENRPAVLILEAFQVELQSGFFHQLAPYSQIIALGVPTKTSVFDLTKIIAPHRTADVLKLLADLLEQGEHPLQIMGALTWCWGKKRGRLAVDRYKKGLLVLQEADYNMKRSCCQPEHALEVALVKLCSLLIY